MPVRQPSGLPGKRGLSKKKISARTVRIDDLERAYAKKCTWRSKLQPLWTRQLRTEEFSRRHSHMGNKQLTDHDLAKTIRGPGYYDVPLRTFKKSNMPENKGFTTGKRFSNVMRDEKPPPGTYFPSIFQDSSVVKKSPSKTPTFDWTQVDRFKPPIDLSWRVPPAVYSPRYTSGIEALLRKRVSTKGPYQLFTGPRDHRTIRNYFYRERCGPDKFYDVGSGLDYLLKHPRKKQNGVIYRKNTYSLKDFFHDRLIHDTISMKPSVPRIRQESVQSIKPVLSKKVAFNSSEHN
ncbi:hypothetical protein QE152_g23750 [Popillia japonica]|uniref:Uncharacterized protein n=1 Tax=Popillia japonica TaxID=7064 RepID=A0AAW1KDI7_POPJA